MGHEVTRDGGAALGERDPLDGKLGEVHHGIPPWLSPASPVVVLLQMVVHEDGLHGAGPRRRHRQANQERAVPSIDGGGRARVECCPLDGTVLNILRTHE